MGFRFFYAISLEPSLFQFKQRIGSELGIKTNKKLNYSLKALLDNPWSSFTEKGLSFGKSFQFNQGIIGIMTSFGKNSSMDPFDSVSSNNQGMIIDFSNYLFESITNL